MKLGTEIAVSISVNLRDLLRHPSPDAEQIWHCDPLAIIDDDGVVAFAGKADVEFKPEPGPDQIGFTKVLAATKDGWVPQLTVKARYERMDRIPDVRLGSRNGFTLLGEDADGVAFSWHIDGAADLILTVRADKDARENEVVELLAIVDSEGQTLYAGPATLFTTPSALPNGAYHIELVGTDLFLETFDTDGVVDPKEDYQGSTYRGIGPDGESFTWYIGAVAEPHVLTVP